MYSMGCVGLWSEFFFFFFFKYGTRKIHYLDDCRRKKTQRIHLYNIRLTAPRAAFVVYIDKSFRWTFPTRIVTVSRTACPSIYDTVYTACLYYIIFLYIVIVYLVGRKTWINGPLHIITIMIYSRVALYNIMDTIEIRMEKKHPIL